MENIMEVLREACTGETMIYACGGYVRDTLLGFPSKDLDIVVRDCNDYVNSLCDYLDQHAIEYTTGAYDRFGTAFVHFLGETVEFIEPRKESYVTGSRNPFCEKGTFRDDVHRRDFTINALYMDIFTGNIVDMLGNARQDLDNRILRTVDDPEKTFNDDPLRILRGIRFAAKYGLTIDFSTSKYMVRLADTINTLSQERVHDEMVRGAKYSEYFSLMSDILPWWLPEVFAPMVGDVQSSKHHRFSTFVHSIMVTRGTYKDNALMRIAAILHDTGKPVLRQEFGNVKGHASTSHAIAARLLDNLKFSNKEKDYILYLVSQHMQPLYLLDKYDNSRALRRFIFKHGDMAEDLVLFSIADIIGTGVPRPDDIYDMIHILEKVRKHANVNRIKLAVNGVDVMNVLDIEPGPRVGEVLDNLMNRVIDQELPNDRKILLDEIKCF